MAHDLSYSQVREAGLFAWHPLGYLFIDGELLRAVRMEPPASDGQTNALKVGRSALRGTEEIAKEGWRHLEGCDCPHCAAGGSADSLAAELAEHCRERDKSLF